MFGKGRALSSGQHIGNLPNLLGCSSASLPSRLYRIHQRFTASLMEGIGPLMPLLIILSILSILLCLLSFWFYQCMAAVACRQVGRTAHKGKGGGSCCNGTGTAAAAAQHSGPALCQACSGGPEEHCWACARHKGPPSRAKQGRLHLLHPKRVSVPKCRLITILVQLFNFFSN